MAQTLTMNRRARLMMVLLLSMIMQFGWANFARAALGDAASPLPLNALAVQSTIESAGNLYDTHETVFATGLRVREYVGRQGAVFAVSWSGPCMPDLQQLFGRYFAEYAASVARTTHPGLRRSLRTVSPQLVVQSGGYLRAYAGRAYLPAQVPAGVALSELQ